jgi:hypothetical protein
MSRRTILRLLIIVALFFQVYAFMAPRNRAHPMSARTIEAFRANGEHQGASTQAVLEEAIAQDVRHNDREHLLVFVPLLVLDCALVYFLWNYGTRQHLA